MKEESIVVCVDDTNWERILLEYLTQNHPDKLKYNPKLIGVTKDHVVFGMKKHMGWLWLTKKKIIETLFPNLK